MVPGMAERERLAVDMRRAAWLDDAVFGPAPQNGALVRLVTRPTRLPRTDRTLWRAGTSWACAVGRPLSIKILRSLEFGRFRQGSTPAQVR